MKKSLKQWLLATGILLASCAGQQKKSEDQPEPANNKGNGCNRCNQNSDCQATPPLTPEKVAPKNTVEENRMPMKESIPDVQQDLGKREGSSGPSISKENMGKTAAPLGSDKEISAPTPAVPVSATTPVDNSMTDQASSSESSVQTTGPVNVEPVFNQSSSSQ